MADEATRQSDNIRAPRISEIIALAVDSTARPYDMSVIALAGASFPPDQRRKHVYLTMLAYGGDIFHHFSSATSATLDDTAKITAGSALAYANTYGVPLIANVPTAVRKEFTEDRWLIVKTATGTATLYFWASSEPTPGFPA